MKRKSDSVRFSRAGDQFHYRWAARRCLALLNPASELDCITIEGISIDESNEQKIGIGEEVVDVAEYFGNSSINLAKKIAYHQLKHSYKVDKPWTLSGLENTLKGFFKRFLEFTKTIEDNNQPDIEFTFTTNRPVSRKVHSLIKRIQKGSLKAEDEKQWSKLKEYLDTKDETIAYDFFTKFRIDDVNDKHWKQRNILIEELTGYIVGADKEVADQLWRLVIDKAMPENANNPEITREEVLRYLNTHDDELFPAPCLIEHGSKHFKREQEDAFLQKILNNDGRPIIIHAEGGIGKTALANRLKSRLPSYSAAALYDCFGNGEYRNPTSLRHPHSIGLVQIANELASLRLCHPLIPSIHAQFSHYLKAFNYRLKQSVRLLKGLNVDAKLVLFIDAADNAQMAAEEYQERASFAKDLIRQELPEGVVAVFLCRSHRIEKLNPPDGFIDLQLKAFSEAETEKLVKQKFSNATRNDIQEFHRLSSQNPRVQASALERDLTLPDTLYMLGPKPTTAEDAIKAIFEESINQLLSSVPEAERQQIVALCEALATLRPFVPIEVLALASGITESAVKSFLIDLGRPLSITGEAVQFFDEPSETWFRDTYKPNQDKLITFVNTIRPLAKVNSYIATAIPQLMLEAGQYNELLELIYEDAELSSENPVDRRNASLQRLQFGLKAALRMKRYEDAAKLALKAGGETAGNDRQQTLLQENTDLVSQLLPDHHLREIVASKTFTTEWHGGHHAYKANLLAGCPETLPESRSYLRLAHRWVRNWSKLSVEDRKSNEMSHDDIAEIALCQLYLNGAEAFVKELERWEPNSVAYHVSKVVFRKLIDVGKLTLLDEVAKYSVNNVYILLALIGSQNLILRYPIADIVKEVLDSLSKYPEEYKELLDGPLYEETCLSVVNSVVQAAITHQTNPYDEIANVLDIYIPGSEKYYFDKFSDEPRFSILQSNCIRAALRREEIELSELANSKIKDQLEKQTYNIDRDAREFLESVGAVLPWHKLWTRVLLGQIELEQIDSEIEQSLSAFNNEPSYYRDKRFITKEISRLWIEILLLSDPTPQRMKNFLEWEDSLEQKLFIPALIRIVKLCAHSKESGEYGYTFAKQAFDLIGQDRIDAEQIVEFYIEISRAVYVLEKKEALYYFDKAVEAAGRIGQENLDRWSSLLELSIGASEPDVPKPELSYRLSRAAEVVYDFVARDKHFDWDRTIEGITKLCPASSLAILSRWKDRSFCLENRDFPYMIMQLVQLGKLSPVCSLAFIGYQYNWSVAELVLSAASSVNNNQMQRMLFDYALRYVEIRGTNSENWERFVEYIAQKDWDDYAFEGYHNESKLSEKLKERRNSGSLSDYKPKPNPRKDWEAIFHDLNPTSIESIQASYQKFKHGDPPFYTEIFAEQFIKRVPQGLESEALIAIFSVPDFSLYDLRELYEAVPDKWISRNYIRSTLYEITRTVCKTHFYEIAQSRYYQPLPYEIVERTSGVTEQEINKWVIEASAANPLILGSGRLFSLVGLIAPFLSRQQAADSLDYGLRLLELEMTEEDGDGDWSPALQPPEKVSDSLAGYVWASLASPRTSERWEAAHVVCSLCAFDKQEILNSLLSFASGENPDPFHDSRFPFYDLSAKLWLLISLRRALKLGYIKAVLLFEDFIKQECRPTIRHIMLRGVSAKILLELHQKKHINLNNDEIDRLSKINHSKQKVIIADTYTNELIETIPVSSSENERFYFGHDISRYWFESLGRMFFIKPVEIEHRALKILRNEWGVTGQGGWKEDPRHIRGVYKERETSHSHGTYPKTENLSFYYSYHSMMIVAGNLVDTAQRFQNSDYSDELEEWINRHQLTRSDGLWLADRRDPKPVDLPSWKLEKVKDDWPFSVTKDQLLNAIVVEDRKICVWGRWSFSQGDRKERIAISSALVNVETAHSLMRAMQTSLHHSDYQIPPSGVESEIDSGLYRLKGWISVLSRDHGIDEYDPWAGEIEFPALCPAKWFIDKFKLQSDYDGRFWRSSKFQNKKVFLSYTWGQSSGEEYEDGAFESGTRLIGDVEAIKHWLSSIGMSLIIEVQISRNFQRNSYHGNQKRAFDYMQPYNLIQLLNANGKIETL